MLVLYLRTLCLYLVLIGVIRLMGKRQIGQLEPSELVVAMLIADLASIPMQDSAIPLLSGLVPILTVLGLELVLSALSLRSIRLRRILCGKPVILIENGKILQDNLRRTRISLDELTGHLREEGVLDLTTVQYTILETDGNLSVFLFPQFQPPSAKDMKITPQSQHLPYTLIADGWVYRNNLKLAGKDDNWLQKTLKSHGATVENTWLLTVDEDDRVLWLRKDGHP